MSSIDIGSDFYFIGKTDEELSLVCSVNMGIRIIWFYEGDEIIMLLDVGHHDILDKQ